MRDVGETKRFEQPRRSRAHVSGWVVAVDDDWAIRIETGPYEIGRELLQRQAHRPRDVRVGELLGRQHVHDLSAGCSKPPDFLSSDCLWHAKKATPVRSIDQRAHIASRQGLIRTLAKRGFVLCRSVYTDIYLWISRVRLSPPAGANHARPERAGL